LVQNIDMHAVIAIITTATIMITIMELDEFGLIMSEDRIINYHNLKGYGS